MRILKLIMKQQLEPMNSDLLCDIGKIYERLFGYMDQGPREDARLPLDSGILMKLTEK